MTKKQDKFLEGYKAGFQNGVMYGSLTTSMAFANALIKMITENEIKPKKKEVRKRDSWTQMNGTTATNKSGATSRTRSSKKTSKNK